MFGSEIKLYLLTVLLFSPLEVGTECENQTQNTEKQKRKLIQLQFLMYMSTHACKPVSIETDFIFY
jgi:hypothetical protein